MEYKILQENIQAYQTVMQQVKRWMLQQKAMNYQHFEGVDQPFLFVEMFDVETIRYERMKRLRCDEEAFFDEWVPGGKDKIHMWAFSETSYVD